MPNYYVAVEKVGIGCVEDENVRGRVKHPDFSKGFCMFAEEKKIGKIVWQLQPGDKLVDYVAPNCWGFSVIAQVEEWEPGKTCRIERGDTNRHYPLRVKVRVLREVNDKHMMPKWKDLWRELKWCRGKSENGARQTLRQPIRQIDEHDYELIAEAIYRACK